METDKKDEAAPWNPFEDIKLDRNIDDVMSRLDTCAEFLWSIREQNQPNKYREIEAHLGQIEGRLGKIEDIVVRLDEGVCNIGFLFAKILAILRVIVVLVSFGLLVLVFK